MPKITDVMLRNTKPGNKPISDSGAKGLRFEPGNAKGQTLARALEVSFSVHSISAIQGQHPTHKRHPSFSIGCRSTLAGYDTGLQRGRMLDCIVTP
jgi:hypothetical protein